MMDLLLAQLVTQDVYHFLYVFLRIGAGIMVIPGIGDGFVQPRVRLLLALGTSVVILPVVSADLPGVPANPLSLLVVVAGELLIGLFLGLFIRLVMTALDVAGMVIAFSMSLAAATVFNPAAASQGSLPGVFLTIAGLTLIFVTDLHHGMLMAIVDSYTVFPPGTLLPAGDAADLFGTTVARSFAIGVQIAMPIIIAALIVNLGLGLLARLMPQVQIFFIAVPINLSIGFIALAVTLAAGLLFWLRHVEDTLMGMLG